MAHKTNATYTSNPETNDVDHVRLLVGDTDCTFGQNLLSDEEIQFRIDGEASNERAAWRSCQDIVSKLTRLAVDWSAGSQSQTKSQLLANYQALEKQLRTRGSGEFAALQAGGISKAEKETQENDSSLVGGNFSENQFRNPRTGADQTPNSLKGSFE